MPRKAKEKPNHGDIFEVKITIGKKPNGSLIRKSFYSNISRNDAAEKGRQYLLEQEIAHRTGTAFVTKEVLFEDWAYRWLETTKKGVVKNYTYNTTYKSKLDKHIVPFFQGAKLKDIRQIDVQAFFAAKASLSRSMLEKFRLILYSIFDLAVENELCYKNPAKHIKIPEKAPQERAIYTDAQIGLLKAECEAIGYIDVLILINTGMRRSELLGLKWSNVDSQACTISVNSAITPDEGKPVEASPKTATSRRIIPISEDFSAYLEKWREEGYIVKGRNGGFMSPSGYAKHYREKMKPLCERIGIPSLTPHELRHTFGTLLRQNNADIYTIQKAMGHADIGITSKIYVHNDIEVLRRNMGLAPHSESLKEE